SHAYGFFGPKGIGKNRLVDFFVQALLCEKKDGIACGQCRNCVLFANDNHTDVYKVVKDPEEKNIGIEKMREMRERIYLAPSISDRNIAVICDAHSLSADAQNSILKVLEEPPKSAIIILIADFTDSLLPTLRSRLLNIRLAHISIGEMIACLEREYPGVSANSVKNAAHLASGKIDLARSLIADKTLLESAEKDYSKALLFLKSPKNERLKMLYDIFSKSMSFIEQQNSGIKFANSILAAAQWSVYEKLGINESPPAFKSDIKSTPNLAKMSKGLFELIQMMKRNIAPRLAFEQFIWNLN
ncbi:hypothetical protein EPN15_04150, partial [Patescibacteria group bacterium]